MNSGPWKKRAGEPEKKLNLKIFLSDDIAVGVNVMTEAQGIGASESVIVEHYREENLSLVTSMVVKELFLVQINKNNQ